MRKQKTIISEDSVTYDQVQEWLTKLELCDAAEDITVTQTYSISKQAFSVRTTNGSTLPQLLKNGVVLCRLLNLIKPGCVDRIQLNTHGPLAILENINRFLTTCRSEFGWNDLFHIDDLYMDTADRDSQPSGDFSKVFQVILRLAGLAEEMGIEPLLRSIQKTTELPPLEDLYALALYDYKATKADELSFQEGDLIHVIHVVDGGWWEGDLGEHRGWFPSNFVEAQQRENLPITPDRNTSVHLSVSPSSNLMSVVASAKRIASKLQRKRIDTLVDKHTSIFVFKNLALKELIRTEERYCADLEHYVGSYMDGLFSETDWLPINDYSVMFGNLKVVYEVNRELLQMLKEASAMADTIDKDQHNSSLSSSPELNVIRGIAKAFTGIADRLTEAYGIYCANFPKAMAVITKYKDHVTMMHFLKEKGVSVQPAVMVLLTCLIKPVQRICKYPLLLAEICRFVDRESEGFSLLKQAETAMTLVASRVNTMKRIEENRHLWTDLRHRIEGKDETHLSNYGKLLLDAVTLMLEDGKQRSRYVLLLSKVVLCLKKDRGTRSKYRLKTVLPLHPDYLLISLPEENKRDTLRFSINFFQKSFATTTSSRYRSSLHVLFEREDERNLWFSTCRSQMHQSKSHLFFRRS